MPRLYFKYGTMGSSKSAQALMCKFNYEQKNMKVLLIKPALDNRGDTDVPKVRSRIGLSADCRIVCAGDSIAALYSQVKAKDGCDCIIIDEAQFCTPKQIDECKWLSQYAPVLCYGLMNNFQCKLFEGSKRLVELADSITEIKSVCRCGRKSTVNARFIDGVCVDEGPEVFIGGDETYENLCYWCWQEELNKGKQN
ncbi:MAG: thymidine kinase [Corallococcus sp.]|nr:thymidine kinase [Corallococcus sp.]